MSLPHTQTTREFSWCAYTEKVRKFATMMTRRGHEVYLYASRDNDAKCVECIECVPPPPNARVTEPDWTTDFFEEMNNAVIRALTARIEPHDFICVIGGCCQEPIAQAFPANQTIEFGIGYQGTFAPFRVFESYAWMHAIYATQQDGAMAANGHFYDCVIPNYFEREQFPYGEGQGGYLLYLGRLIQRKGLIVAIETARRADMPLKVAGQEGDFVLPDDVEYVGLVGPEARAQLLGNATALLAPTLYVEPFGGVVVEAQMCGTPAITTDWGAFTETVDHGASGYRCHTLPEFVQAVKDTQYLDRYDVRGRALRLYSTDNVAKQYEEYFERVQGLWGIGVGDWYGETN